MTTTLTSEDLLTRMTQEEFDELTASQIESGQSDPVAKAIDGGLGEIKVYLSPDTLEAVSTEMMYRVWLSLAVPLLYPRRAVVPEKHLKEQTWAREFLTKLSEGKVGPWANGASWGSETKIKPRDRE